MHATKRGLFKRRGEEALAGHDRVARDKDSRSNGQREVESARLLQFLGWVIPLVFGFSVLAGAAYAVFGDAGSAIAGVILFAYGCLLLLAHRCVREGKRDTAVAIICVGLLVATLGTAAVQPGWLPILAITPLLSVAVALPYVRGEALLRLILLAWLVTVFVAVLSRTITPLSTPPAWFEDAFTVSSLAAAVATVLLLLWQFSSRLNDTLAQTRSAEERYALAERGVNDGLWDWDLESDVVYYSPRWKQMLGHAEHQVGTSPDEWIRRVHPEDRESLEGGIRAHLDGHKNHLEIEYRILHRDGHYRWMLSRGLAVRDENGKATRMAGSQTDITRRKQAEERLLHDAFHDALTGLPNRALFLDRLDDVLRWAKRDARYQFAIQFIDLDRFKIVNDSLGHTMGDRLLMAVGDRLKNSLRPGDTIARLGGDEFTVLLEDVSGVEDAERVADRLLEELKNPFRLGGYELFTTASIGIVLGTGAYEKPEDLLRDADTAMYRAKALGRSRKGVFESKMHSRAVALFRLETELRRAIERNEFVVHYQPIVSLKTGGIVGFEALVRWRHPERGLVHPAEFVSVAEETGLIIPLELFVMRESCGKLASWQERFPAHLPLTISVNLSRNQLARPELFEQIERTLWEVDLDAHSLRLEITEGAIMQNVEAAAMTLTRLRDLNVRVHIDDFGMGYSSLSALHNFPIDALKVDRSFVARMNEGGDHTEIVQTIVSLAHNLGLDVIAEGVETSSQLEELRRLGCDYGQGYLFSEPLDAPEAGTLLSAGPQW